MNKESKISIITPSYNRAYIIDETAASIFSQTYTNWEWVIVDDGSTDDSWERLQSYAQKDDRVKAYKRNREPKGACTCRNIAVEKCTGDYVMFLDTDDVLASFCLEQRINAFNDSEGVDFIVFPMLLFKKELDDTKLLWNIDKDEDDLLRILKGDAICQGTGTLWRRESFMKVGMWKDSLKLWQDIELHIRSLLWPVRYKKRMDLLPDVFLRISDDSLSRVGYYSRPKMESRIAVYEDICAEIDRQNKLSTCREGLRIMGLDIVLGAVKSAYHEGASSLLAFCNKLEIFTYAEIKQLKLLIMLSKYKLYKINSLYSFFWKKAAGIAQSNDVTLTRVVWEGEVKR